MNVTGYERACEYVSVTVNVNVNMRDSECVRVRV